MWHTQRSHTQGVTAADTISMESQAITSIGYSYLLLYKVTIRMYKRQSFKSHMFSSNYKKEVSEELKLSLQAGKSVSFGSLKTSCNELVN